MTDLIEKLAQEAAELICGGDWQNGKWYSDGQRDAWRRGLKPAADRIEKLEAALLAVKLTSVDFVAVTIAVEALEGKDD